MRNNLTAAERAIYSLSLPDQRDRKRALMCQKPVICERMCGKCRTKWSRVRKLHLSITDEEFQACKTHFREIGVPMTHARMRRYVHETLRRRNAPYEGETKICVRMSSEELAEVRRDAEKVGLSMQDFAFAALALADAEHIADVLKGIREGDHR